MIVIRIALVEVVEVEAEVEEDGGEEEEEEGSGVKVTRGTRSPKPPEEMKRCIYKSA